MTNEQIIFNERIRLMQEGTIKGTGRMMTITYEDGSKDQIEEPEQIHTFNGWKTLGFSVKKGEKSKIKFTIWKYTTKMLNTDTGNAELDKINAAINDEGGDSNMFMKMSAFFTADQVQPIEAH